MKKLLGSSLLLFMAIAIISCKTEEKKVIENKDTVEVTTTTEEEVVQTAETRPDSVLFIGKWQRTDKNMSFEFKEGWKCIPKMEGEAREEVSWKINPEKRELIIYLGNGARQFNYKIHETSLHLQLKDRKKVIEFHRID